MALGPMTRKWLIVILVAIGAILVGVWLYTAYAAEEVEPEVADDPVGVASASAPLAPPLPPPTLLQR